CPLLNECRTTDVSLEAALSAASTPPSPGNDGGMSPLAGARGRAPVERAITEDRGSHSRADESDDRVPRATPRTEPHLSLPLGLGAVFDECWERDRITQQPCERNAVPADVRRIDQRLAVVFDDARNADPNPKDASVPAVEPREHLG